MKISAITVVLIGTAIGHFSYEARNGRDWMSATGLTLHACLVAGMLLATNALLSA